MRPHPFVRIIVLACGLLVLGASPVAAKSFGAWSTAVPLESLAGSSSDVNTAYVDGCPIQSPDGLRLYMASTRPGGYGGIDIWIAQRDSTDQGFGTPVNAGSRINSAVDDFCPTPVRGHGLFFVSRRSAACAANSADIYFARLNPFHGWSEPAHLGCTLNSAGDEFSPSYVEENGLGVLYFSSNRNGNHDIFRSVREPDGTFGAPQAVTDINTAYDEFRPNVRKDGGEIVFDSNRPGGLGATDIYASSRSSLDDPWSTPVNLGSAINSAAAESRASLSWDGTTLLFGSTRAGGEGASDIYLSTRDRTPGG